MPVSHPHLHIIWIIHACPPPTLMNLNYSRRVSHYYYCIEYRRKELLGKGQWGLDKIGYGFYYLKKWFKIGPVEEGADVFLGLNNNGIHFWGLLPQSSQSATAICYHNWLLQRATAIGYCNHLLKSATGIGYQYWLLASATLIGYWYQLCTKPFYDWYHFSPQLFDQRTLSSTAFVPTWKSHRKCLTKIMCTRGGQWMWELH